MQEQTGLTDDIAIADIMYEVRKRCGGSYLNPPPEFYAKTLRMRFSHLFCTCPSATLTEVGHRAPPGA